MAKRSAITKFLKGSCVIACTQFDKMVKFVSFDNGTNFRCLKDYFDENRIIFQTSCMDTLQYNGQVVKKHRISHML